MENSICILIVTANENETKALLDDKDFKYKTKRSNYANDVNFYNIGTYGYYKVVHFELISQGSIGADAAQLSIATAIDAFNPAAVILVGIAFGIEFSDNPKKVQRIGDVLISDLVADYTRGKIKNGELQSDGFVAESGRQLLSTFKFYSKSWKHKVNNKLANCEFGLILSGDYVIDDKLFKEKLIKSYPRAIGGEMEGRGAYSACRNKEISEWIIVKAICDWADGTKSQNKQRNQIVASKSAVSLINHVLTSKDSLKKLKRGNLPTDNIQKNHVIENEKIVIADVIEDGGKKVVINGNIENLIF